jgi:hypothetical protein
MRAKHSCDARPWQKVVAFYGDAPRLSSRWKSSRLEVLMDRRSFPFKLTSEDHLTIQKWTWGFAALYGAVLLVLVLMVAAGPYTKTETANSRIEHGFSAATIADPRTDRTGSPLLVP